ncbi:hypothetical protein AXF42_Ash017537 [Apostasia shenzhenica]|uniref:DUF7036 domain-containing protein n=1 Tax=Apostasia shenzhenica TaxID=1088818 RepID=A0A2I0A385_9ASPA|nr:hypothetical protein AXF42_Ash017537 [Apostasia shenzhenica]
MGKPEEQHIEIPPAESAAAAATGAPHRCAAGIRRLFSVRCGVVLILSVGVFLSAIFWIPHGRFRSGLVPDRASAASAEIQASFILQKPLSLLASHTEKLEYDIFEEIGIPNTKVSIISMQPTAAMNSTSVAFGVLPDPTHASISLPALSLLRSSFIDLVLQQINLTLTSSFFGETLSFEVLKFPGGITIIPPQTASIWERTQALFNFTVSNSIFQIKDNLKEMKEQLKFGLKLKTHENVYVQMTNVDGSTVASPVTVQATVLSDYGFDNLPPNRLKQLADILTVSHDQNLGLNHSVFGEVNSIVLSSYLNMLVSSLGAPCPSPSLAPVAAPWPSPSKEFADYSDPPSTLTLAPLSQHKVLKIDSYSYVFENYVPNPAIHWDVKSPRMTFQREYSTIYRSNLLLQEKESISSYFSVFIRRGILDPLISFCVSGFASSGLRLHSHCCCSSVRSETLMIISKEQDKGPKLYAMRFSSF